MFNFSGVNMEATGRRLKTLRESKGYTVAYICDLLYVSPQAVSKWQSGKALPNVENLIILSRLFGVHMEDLFVMEDEKSSDFFRRNVCRLFI